MSSKPAPDGRAPRSGGYAKGRATREVILDAATALFGELGYRSASLREIAARAGVSHPGLLHHFPTKESLLAAVLAHRDEVDGAAIEADRATGMDFFEALARVAERNAARPRIVELFCTLSAEATSAQHPAHAYFRRRYADLVSELTGELEQRSAAGRLRAGTSPGDGARTVVALMDGLQVQWLLEREGEGPQVDMAAVLRGYLSVLLG
ncbi:TetR/AcrR family transcriptional regulator [Sanguibacter antarcticus]|uniref:TetR family transcriptional regulator n=1 Tax=Sanguibacter antarcticus TaxID=372484 RepID=A0A2A9E848_9MICO|nr:TetR/AcrR family transcriptional regulator [Sanguibacter antarcticus]PFG35034.1 TetR family transcriptional regulator [Sanguibacter antarcticus]